MNHTINHNKLGYAAVAAAAVIGVAAYQENIRDLIQPRAPVPPVTQVYNNDSCLAYNGKTYVLKNEIAIKGDGIERLILRHNPSVTSELGAAFKVANSGRKFLYGNGLYKGRQYLTPAPDYENKCK